MFHAQDVDAVIGNFCRNIVKHPLPGLGVAEVQNQVRALFAFTKEELRMLQCGGRAVDGALVLEPQQKLHAQRPCPVADGPQAVRVAQGVVLVVADVVGPVVGRCV